MQGQKADVRGWEMGGIGMNDVKHTKNKEKESFKKEVAPPPQQILIQKQNKTALC